MKFKNITEESPKITSLLMSNLYDNKGVEVYEHKDTTVIFTFNEGKKHASISNPNRKIKKAEIEYAIQKIMKTKINNVKLYLSTTGVIHINTEVGVH